MFPNSEAELYLKLKLKGSHEQVLFNGKKSQAKYIECNLSIFKLRVVTEYALNLYCDY